MCSALVRIWSIHCLVGDGLMRRSACRLSDRLPMVVVGKGVVNVVNWGVGCEDKVGMVFGFGVRGPSGDRCNMGHGV